MKTLHPHEPFTHAKWLTNVRRSMLIAIFVVLSSLGIGVLGYHVLGGFNWVDSILEASMILGGMGPFSPMTNDAVKIFASIYALFSGLILVGTTGLLLAPWLQRTLYHTHRQARTDALHEETESKK